MRSPSDDNGIGDYLTRVEERIGALRNVQVGVKNDQIRDFQDKLLISWIYHDNALEGIVLTFHELQSALEQDYIADLSLVSTFEDIRAHKEAIELVLDLASKKRGEITLELIKRVYAALTPSVGDVRLVRYRKETPLHRLYFHEIAPPEKISYRMRRLVEWLGSAQAKNMHPLKLAAKMHYRLMHIYPFPTGSGKLARLMMNFLLLKSGYQPAIIHATDRQRYYDALRSPHSGLTRLICESLLNSLEGMIRAYDEAGSNNGFGKVMVK